MFKVKNKFSYIIKNLEIKDSRIKEKRETFTQRPKSKSILQLS